MFKIIDNFDNKPINYKLYKDLEEAEDALNTLIHEDLGDLYGEIFIYSDMDDVIDEYKLNFKIIEV